MATEPVRAVKIFYCYAREDRALRDELEKHLGALKRSGKITTWYDREIQPGTDWEREIEARLDTADVILLLVSPDFMHSDYCYGVEMGRAQERHDAGISVIPVILRPVLWRDTPISKFQLLPIEGKPITVWPDRDAAFQDVAEGIYKVAEELRVRWEEQRLKAQEVERIRKARWAEEERTRRMEEERQRRAEEERARQAEKERERKAREEQALRDREERQHQAEIERQRLTPNEVVSPSLSSPGSVQSSNTAAAGPFLPLTSPPFIPGNQPRQKPPPGVVVASRITRRKIVVGLGLAGLTVAGGGIAWLVSSQGEHSPVVPGQTPTSISHRTPTPSPTAIPLGTTLYIYHGHSVSPDRGYVSSVNDVAWSPDGARIASAAGDHTVQVWDAADGGHVFTYLGHASSVVDAVAWSPDGTRIVSAGNDQTVQVWDAADGGHVFTYRGHTAAVLAVAWSPNGTRIASAAGDHTVQVWDAADGGHVFTYREDSGKVAWSPNGTRIVSAGNDQTVQVWDAANGGNAFTYHGHSDIVESVAWSPNGTRIVSAGNDQTVQVWDAADGGHVFTYRGHTAAVLAVAWSPNGTRIASGGLDHTVQVWQAS